MSEFFKPTKHAWIQKVLTDLSLTDMCSLEWILEPGLSFDPIYSNEDVSIASVPISKPVGWRPGCTITVSSASEANQLALAMLNCGCADLSLVCPTNFPSEDWLQLFEGIQLNLISVHLRLSVNQYLAFIHFLKDQIKRQAIAESELTIAFTLTDVENYTPELVEKLLGDWKTFPHWISFVIGAESASDGTPKTDDIARQLQKANALVTILMELGQINVPQHIHLHHELDESHLAQIGYLRALRICWLNILRHWGWQDYDVQNIRGEIFYSTTSDVNIEKISFTIQAMSAIIGGVSFLSMGKYGSLEELDQSRLALNIQHLLPYESHLDQSIDPAAGSYFFEFLTQKLASNIWQSFQVTQHAENPDS